jgi:hypothetical protein
MSREDSIEPKVNPNSDWKVNGCKRLSACDNRPGLKKMYVTVLDQDGNPLQGIKVRFETEASEGIAYDHMNIWGLTNEDGYIEWDHLGVPTRYVLFMEDDEIPLIGNIRTDLGNEYCKPPGSSWWSGNVPVNRPGIYSYRIEIQKKGEAEPVIPPVISNVEVKIYNDDGDEGYASGVVSCDTDVDAEVKVYYGLYYEGGSGDELEPTCDPYSVGGWRGRVVSEPGQHHLVELPSPTLWYSSQAQKRYCLQVMARRVDYPHAKSYSDTVSFSVPSA